MKHTKMCEVFSVCGLCERVNATTAKREYFRFHRGLSTLNNSNFSIFDSCAFGYFWQMQLSFCFSQDIDKAIRYEILKHSIYRG